MTEFEPPSGGLPVPEHDHDILLIAGSRPEVARLAPIATAFNDADRIQALTVATGPDPMTVHEAFEALG
ncbi:MAG: UDP-N-acetylglucosamine 2-epimerase, partial [Stackebrandtia sp.]